MIDEKKIEESAEKECGGYALAKEGFKVGINWFKKNIWHDSEEAPLNDELLLVQRIDHRLVRYDIFTWDSFNDKWEEVKGNYNITKWCYLKDLI